MSCNNNTPNVNKTFIIEPLSLTGDTPVLSACTSMYTNLVQSCSGDTTITLGTGIVTFNSNINGIQSITANTIEATTYLSGGTNILDIINANDTFVTGGTFNDIGDSISLVRNDGANVVITGLTNFYTTGGTYNNSTGLITFNRNDQLSAFTVDLSSIDINDTFVTGTTLSGNILTLERNDGFDISTDLTPIVFSGGVNDCITDLYVTNIYGCSPITIKDTLIVSGATNLQASSFYNLTVSGSNPNEITNVAYVTGYVQTNEIYSTGGTYNSNVLTINRNDGGLFNVTITGLTDTFVTAATLNSTTIELDRNEGLSTLNVDLLPVLSGKTNLSLFNTYTGNTQTILNTKVENSSNLGGGNEIFSGKSGTTLIFNTISGGSNTTITQVGNVQKIDVAVPASENTFVTGGTYNTNTDIITFNNNSGGTFNVTGITDTFVTGTTFTSNEGTLTRNDGSEIFKLSGGTNVTLSNPSSNQIKIDVTIPTDTNTFVTGGTYSDSTNIITLDRNDAVSLNITGLTNTYVTGGTVSISATDNTNSGTIGLFYKDSDGTPRTLPFEDTFTSGGTYNNGTKLITFDRNDGNNYNISLSSISTTNTYVTGFTYNDANTFTLERNEGESDLTATINSVTGFTVNGNLVVTGDTNVKGLTGTSAVLSANTDTILTLIGSGSTNPIFKIEGSSGELFTVTDSLIGSLFAVNNISGLQIFEVFSDDRVLMGSYLAPSLNTTVRTTANSGVTNIYSIPTSAYTGAFFDYTLVGNGGARSGNIMSIWSGTTAEFNEVTTNDIGSSTNGVTFNVLVSGSSAILAVSAVTGTYTIKTIVRSI